MTPVCAERASARPASYRYPLALLTVIYVVNFVDRQLVTIVAEPIKHEFALTDWQVGALSGLSFAFLYTIAGFPLAQLAERSNRARIIATALLAWSFCTALCGMAQTALQFVLARIGVGIGEAGCTPPAHSLIVQIVPPGRRASALAIYAMGAPLGQLLGMAIGGVVAARWGWRSAFVIAGAPGVVLAIVAGFALAEPRRTNPGPAGAGKPPAGPFWPTIRALVASRSFMLIAWGGAAASFVFYGLGAFYASFFLRNHGVQLQQIADVARMRPLGVLGVVLGLTSGIAGVAGAIIGGRATDAWGRHNAAANVLMPVICTLAAAPLLFLAMLVSGLWPAIGLIALASALNSAWVGGAYAAALGLVSPAARAVASALMMFLFNLVGLGLGPLGVGLLSDLLAPLLGSGNGLRWAMAGATFGGLVAAGLFWTARTSLARDTIS